MVTRCFDSGARHEHLLDGLPDGREHQIRG